MLINKPILPQPDLIALEHSQKLLELITTEIQSKGNLSFARYMELVLYAPGLGYYSAGARKFGAMGDYVTAPEISSLFSYCLARQCQQVLNSIPESEILELGAGSGIMAADLLTELARQGCLPKAYYILEVSADLRERQWALFQEKIPGLLDRIIWLDQLPEQINGIILANEVLDALPVHQFKIAQGIQEVAVKKIEQQLVTSLVPATPELEIAVQQLGSFSDGYESEINLLIKPWLRSLAKSLQRGIMVFIDYGFPQSEYYHPDRSQGTLMCHYRHHAHTDPFFLPGLQDITAHVNFTAVAEAAVAAGLSVIGYTTQAYFLLSCGISNFLEQAMDTQHYFSLAQQVKQLTLPSEMGELFKVLMVGKKFDHDLLGMHFSNSREKL